MEHESSRFSDIIRSSRRSVFFTGAGVSVASGIPDFRSMGGLFDEISRQGHSPEYLLSRSHLVNEPESFVRFYRKRLMYLDKAPNIVHDFIAAEEKNGRSLGVITQNIDGLHTEAGSRNVDELHGTINHFHCTVCHRQFAKQTIIEQDMTQCDCGGVVRPDIVLYEEMLDESVIRSAMDKLERADTLIVMGTSLVVNPAAFLINYFNGNHFVIINKDETPFDRAADLTINQDMTDVIAHIYNS
ncbi:NAD-dependent protein deacylase [Salinicoccus sp. ID82-1]|uniref:protein acetyllysine N-acetyltransferase n=1 Tax=Salinicoccus cyprini TaxID=2493691 RepID=A0A558AZ93_9STAP|nr:MULTISPECIES: NAD-dependent protein deacylase [Salinicoccus]MCG1009161.1 NAD-dependent protein deacylase [Salinicoccus sp. ID82-1]TVT29605.1 NAD-dependent protein deacylase [Salinicoccus cyprini]